MKRLLVIIALAAMGMFADAGRAGAQATGATVEKRVDRMFYSRASAGGQFEVQLGQLAQQNGSTQEVKDLGAMLVKDHTDANQQLATIAQNKGMQVSTQPSPREEKRLEHFRSLTGADFDHAFVAEVIKDHREDIKLFEHEAKSGADPEAKAYASTMVPKLREHLQHAETVMKDLPKKTGGMMHMHHHGGAAPGTTQGGTPDQSGGATGGTTNQ